jgi:hypothetical protein
VILETYPFQLSVFILGFMIAELKNWKIHKLPKPILVVIKAFLCTLLLSIIWLGEFRKSLSTWSSLNTYIPESGILKFMGSRLISPFPPHLEMIVFSSALVLLAELSETVQKVFSSDMFLYLGKASFGLYIMHMRISYFNSIVATSSASIIIFQFISPWTFPFDDLYIKHVIVVLGTLLFLAPIVFAFYVTADQSVPRVIFPLITRAFDIIDHRFAVFLHDGYALKYFNERYIGAALESSTMVFSFSGKLSRRRILICCCCVIFSLIGFCRYDWDLYGDGSNKSFGEGEIRNQ